MVLIVATHNDHYFHAGAIQMWIALHAWMCADDYL